MKHSTRHKMLGGSRRTRQVFGMNKYLKLIGFVLIVAVVILGLYLIFSMDKAEQDIEEKEAPVKEEEKVVESIETIDEEDEVKETKPEEEEIKKEEVYDSGYSYDNPYGDTSEDAGFDGNCKTMVNDIKSDIDQLYEFKIKAQEEYDEALAELKKTETKLDEANEDLDEKRESLDEVRKNCIDEGSPN